MLEAHTITGAGDLWARVVARSNTDLQRVIDQVLADVGDRAVLDGDRAGDPGALPGAAAGVGRRVTADASADQVRGRVTRSWAPIGVGVEVTGVGDDADARLEAVHAAHGAAMPTGAGLELTDGSTTNPVCGVALAASRARIALPARALAERVPRADPVADVEVGPRRARPPRARSASSPSATVEVGGAADGLGERRAAPGRRGRAGPAARRRRGGARPGRPAGGPRQVLAYQRATLERADQPVHRSCG